MRPVQSASSPAFLNQVLYPKAFGPPCPFSCPLNVIEDIFQITFGLSWDDHSGELSATRDANVFAFGCALDDLRELLFSFK
jgi:hypothetical protein